VNGIAGALLGVPVAVLGLCVMATAVLLYRVPVQVGVVVDVTRATALLVVGGLVLVVAGASLSVVAVPGGVVALVLLLSGLACVFGAWLGFSYGAPILARVTAGR